MWQVYSKISAYKLLMLHISIQNMGQVYYQYSVVSLDVYESNLPTEVLLILQ